MKLILIAAEAANKVIGNDGKMPWHIPEDLWHFKEVTSGQAVIMGRKTWESLGSKPLPNRANVVVSKTLGPLEGAHSVRNFRTAVKTLIAAGYDRVYVIGGESLYRAALPWASKIILTKLYKSYKGDTHFPDIDPLQWTEYDKVDVLTEEGYGYLQLRQNTHDTLSQPFTIYKYMNVNQPDVAKWVDLIKD
ncbi:putative dihydrofolate reductase [Burkholderia phage FLC6]|nr:putative dihydrofolate reductase [Burkholderia phage FLC6]